MDSATIKKTLRETYNAIAPDFDQTRKEAWRPVQTFLCSIPKGSLVLDLGGGTGRHALVAQSHGHAAICYDQSLGQLRQALKNGVRHTVVGDVLHLPFKNKTADAILYIATLHHLPAEEERIESLQECERVLKENGLLLVSVWKRGQKKFEKNVDAQGNIHHTWRGKYERFYHLFTEEELKTILKKANLTVDDCWEEDDNIWAIARKQS